MIKKGDKQNIRGNKKRRRERGIKHQILGFFIDDESTGKNENSMRT
jgi:hypothetical protein